MKKKEIFMISLIILFSIPIPVYAMHIGEGFLQPKWCITYFVVWLPFFYLGLKDIKKKIAVDKDIKMLLALIAAFTFVLSALKLPSVTGSSSHATGTGLGAMIFGPFTMTVISTIVLLFQALLLAHGGITTLGANAISMGVMGPLVAYFVYRLIRKRNKKLSIFLAAALGDLTTYITTATQLALAYPDKSGGIAMAFIKFMGIFAITQIPLAIIEGLVTVVIFDFIEKNSGKELSALRKVE